MKVKEIIKIMNEIAPPELAMSFDHVGLMTGSFENNVNSIMVCLDLDDNVLQEAISKKCDMVITHHPLIFTPLADLTEDSVRGKLLCNIVRNGITVFSAHTNLDFSMHGVNYALAARLGLQNITSTDDQTHRFGALEKPMTLKEFAEFADKILEADGIKCIVPKTFDKEKKITRVGVSCGSFDRETDWVYENNIDVLVTGEVKHSDAIDLSMQKFATLSCGHYPTEIWGAVVLYGLLIAAMPDMNVVMSQNGNNPLVGSL